MIADLLAALARLVAGPTVSWTDDPPDSRRRVYIANHCSHLDFIVLWSCFTHDLRPRIRPVAAGDYWLKSRLRRYLAHEVFHAVLIDRRRPASSGVGEGEAGTGREEALARMLEALDDGSSLILFPEGTRGSGAEIAPFRSGLFYMCQARPSLEVVPVRLENLNRILPKGKWVPVPILTRITFGVPFQLEAGEQKDAFLARARERVEGLRAP